MGPDYYQKYLKYKRLYLGGKYQRLYLGGNEIKNNLLETDKLYQTQEIRKRVYDLLYPEDESREDDSGEDSDSEEEEEADESKVIVNLFNSCRILVCFYTVCYLINEMSNFDDTFLRLTKIPFIVGNLRLGTSDYLTYPNEITEGVNMLGIFFQHPDVPGLLSPLHYMFILKSKRNTYIRQAWLTSGLEDSSKTMKQMSVKDFDLDKLESLTRPDENYFELIKDIFGLEDPDANRNGPFYIYWMNEEMIMNSVQLINE